jgi:thiamine biosynthesis lipoprotein
VKAASVHSVALMGTIVTIEVVGRAASTLEEPAREQAIGRALDWFQQIEDICSRFDETSELRQLSARIGAPVHASGVLFEALQFALMVAAETGGAFDPTVGRPMEARGFNRHYRTGQAADTPLAPGGAASYRDVRLDPAGRTITLLRPLVLDLGAVAKGLAIDLAARELQPFENFAIYAGGDLYLGGNNAEGRPWSVGIRHPREPQALIETVRVSGRAVCTSGDYERRAPAPGAGHHIMDPRTGGAATACASVTVLASSAMVADVLATAAFVLGPADGLQLLERHGVDGLIITPALERFATRGMSHE